MNTTFSIKPHSIVDLITNSSTTIYTNNPSHELVKKIFNAVLAAAGSDKKAEDLFTFTTIPDMYRIADMLDDDIFGESCEYLEIADQIKYANLVKDKLPKVLKECIPSIPVDEEQVEKFQSIWYSYRQDDNTYSSCHEIKTLLAEEIVKGGDADKFINDDDGRDEFLHIELKPEYKDTLTKKQIEALNSLHCIFNTEDGGYG